MARHKPRSSAPSLCSLSPLHSAFPRGKLQLSPSDLPSLDRKAPEVMTLLAPPHPNELLDNRNSWGFGFCSFIPTVEWWEGNCLENEMFAPSIRKNNYFHS